MAKREVPTLIVGTGMVGATCECGYPVFATDGCCPDCLCPVIRVREEDEEEARARYGMVPKHESARERIREAIRNIVWLITGK